MQKHPGTVTPSSPALYHGWLVVAAAFLVALFGFGLGFYGPGVYLVALEARHGWPVAELAPAITLYYAFGAALLFFCVGPLFDRYGARRVVTAGALAMAAGLAGLAMAARQWQVYAAFAVMSFGWATMSSAAINIIVAPWFERRRGVAVSWALNGGSAGGVLAPPLLLLLIAHSGFAVALDLAAASLLLILLPLVAPVLRRRRSEEHDRADAASPIAQLPPTAVPEWRLGPVLRSARFATISGPFALALTAQVGFLTHQVAFLAPSLGTITAGWAVSLTTFAGFLGRIAMGPVADRVERRKLAAGNFAVQAAGIGILATATAPAMLYFGCLLFGLGLGNTTSLPGLIVQHEFPRQHFARIVGLVVAINQFSFAFGPSLLGRLEEAQGGYTSALCLCLAMQAAAAVIILLPTIRQPRKIPA